MPNANFILKLTRAEANDVAIALQGALDRLLALPAAAMGRLPAEVLDPGEGWPALYGSYDELAAANGAAEEQQ